MRVKYLFYLNVLLLHVSFNNTNAQDRYIEQNGTIVFEASKSFLEEVRAKNESVTAIINTDNGEIAALALMTGFRFKNSLMEEHFNENYVESKKYPKATFKGRIADFAMNKIIDSPSEYKLHGNLELHGKEKEINMLALVKKVNGIISMKGTFMVSPSDFAIKIPSVVGNKIAEKVTVTIEFEFLAE